MGVTAVMADILEDEGEETASHMIHTGFHHSSPKATGTTHSSAPRQGTSLKNVFKFLNIGAVMKISRICQ